MSDATSPFDRIHVAAREALNSRDHVNYAALAQIETALVELRGVMTVAEQKIDNEDIRVLLVRIRTELFGSGEPPRLPRNPPRVHIHR